ncbi:MAG: zinc ribbon domain-containing protein [Anaerolineae bacterium]|nr:zinc ribbon domain-containing protein [Anaerolineae bacterium]
MGEPSRMPNYDVRNDGIGPYAVFYCESCNREHRSKPDVTSTIAKDIGRQAMGGLLRKVPVLGGAAASSVMHDDPRYSHSLTEQQLDHAWDQVKDRFRECPTCGRIVCLSCWDEQSGYCEEDSPRSTEIAQAEAEQAGAVLKGFASALGLGEVFKQAGEAAKQAAANVARCPNCQAVATAGTKFCPECGTAMTQPKPPAATACPNCGADVGSAKFCPECGTKIERAPSACPSCGAPVQGAKFCPECGTKIV